MIVEYVCQTTDALVAFLQEKNVHTTHFMIGLNILQYWGQFLKAFEAGDDITVHTYTHPFMTTLSNEDVVAQVRIWASFPLFTCLICSARMDNGVDS